MHDPKALLDLKDLRSKLDAKDFEVMFKKYDGKDLDFAIQYCFKITSLEFLIFPLKQGKFITRGIHVYKLLDDKISFKLTQYAPLTLINPGVSVLKKFGKFTGIVFLGGNEGKMCYKFDV